MLFDDELIRRLRHAKHLVFFTGAGISAESGIATFRDHQDSLWINFNVADFATAAGFCSDPARSWQWYAERRRQIQLLSPNPAHQVIACWQDKMPNVNVITQNIDGFHQQAGSKDVIELHGNLSKNKCFDHGHVADQDVGGTDLQIPKCSLCNSLLRPDVVWFDEELPTAAFDQAEHLSFNSEVFVSIGCSLEVHPAASLPLNASRSGAYLIQINPNFTQLDGIANCNIHGKAGEILPLLWQSVWREPLPT